MNNGARHMPDVAVLNWRRTALAPQPIVAKAATDYGGLSRNSVSERLQRWRAEAGGWSHQPFKNSNTGDYRSPQATQCSPFQERSTHPGGSPALPGTDPGWFRGRD